MNKQNVTVASHKEKSTLVRPKFGPGMLLQHEDLDLMSTYTQKLSRLMFRSLFGCGVICGLTIETKRECEKDHVIVHPGVGLDCSGYPIQVPKAQRLTLGDQVSADNKVPLWVVLCGTVTCCAPRTSLCASDDDEAPAVCTRERDGFEIKVVTERPKCVCGCKDPEDREGEIDLLIDTECKCVNPKLECYEDHYNGKCGCNCDECSDCNGQCILLARLDKSENMASKDGGASEWDADHSVRRFIRPVLMRDPQVEIERQQLPNNEEQLVGEAARASAVKKVVKAKHGKVSP